MKNIILRGIALYIDVMFVALGTVILFLLHQFLIDNLKAHMEDFHSFVLFRYYFISYFSYFLITEFFFSTTFVKKVFGFKIKYLNGNGKRDFLSILLRNSFRLVPFEQISFLFNKEQLFWHELISNTRVNKTIK